MKPITIFLFAFFAFFIFSCNHSDLRSKTENLSLAPPEADKSVKDVMINTNSNLTKEQEKTDSSKGISLQGSVPGQNPDWDKKIIKTATLRIEVKNFKGYNDIVHKAAKQYGGYVANEEQSQSDEKLETTISIKVPVEQFESLVSQLPSDSDKVMEKKITTEDVTGEVVDTKSRLQAKEQMRLRYLEFLKQSKDMEDVLKVQGEINTIQEEMESASARINFLSHQSAYSTINLTFYQPLAGYNLPQEHPNFFTRTSDAFKAGFNFITELFIGVISIWPFILIIMLGWLFWKKRSFSIAAAKQKL